MPGCAIDGLHRADLVHLRDQVELLRHFVCGRCQPCRQPYPYIHDEDPGDGQPTEEVVKPVPDQDQIGERLLGVGPGAMGVVPMEELLQSKEHDEASSDEAKRRHHRHAEERRGNHVKQRAADQRPGGEGHERQEDLVEGRLPQQQGHAADQRQRAHQQARQQDPKERGHGAPSGRALCVSRTPDVLTLRSLAPLSPDVESARWASTLARRAVVVGTKRAHDPQCQPPHSRTPRSALLDDMERAELAQGTRTAPIAARSFRGSARLHNRKTRASPRRCFATTSNVEAIATNSLVPRWPTTGTRDALNGK